MQSKSKINNNIIVDEQMNCYNNIILVHGTGTVDEVHCIDPQLWLRGMLESSRKPQLCPNFFEESETILSLSLGLRHKDISKFNCRNVYIQFSKILTN